MKQIAKFKYLGSWREAEVEVINKRRWVKLGESEMLLALDTVEHEILN